ncbi:MAG: galactokinase [Candidatus Enterosoma sp.]|nr:galactokinase [Bacilli bacterium]MDD7607879.1 galactokinase [bacterium]MDY5866277.1 galactokinase [Candidatus Enterosoma sp.]
MNIDRLIQSFSSVFNEKDDLNIYFAPGRVNLIGEHIDYNGGHVFPCALSVGTALVCRKRNDRKLRMYSCNVKKAEVVEASLDDVKKDDEHSWVNYPLGVVKTLQNHGYEIPYGFDMLFFGNISGSGLSSSASLEVVTCYMIVSELQLGLSNTLIAIYCKEAENKFNGLNCGIMDQFACANGKREQAMYLDCATLDNKYVKVNIDPYQIVVINSQVKHSLTSSHYNERLEECQKALKIIQEHIKVENLCSLSVQQFESLQQHIEDPTIRKRAKFAVEEEDRVKKAIDALNRKDVSSFAEMINLSGDGLRYDYDATCPEIDILVEACRSYEHCIASRETGGGWGGNVIALVRKDKIEEFKAHVDKIYIEKTSLHPTYLNLIIGQGVHKVKYVG